MRSPSAPTRRDFVRAVGRMAGASAAYGVMSQLGLAHASTPPPAFRLEGAPRGASVLVLGAGIAGLVAAMELQRAGYRVQVVEFNARPGGRSWTLRGGDRYTELGGATQQVRFDAGQYFNPGPWRIPYHHHALLGYCRALGVALQPFVQVNHNAYLHSTQAFGGRPVRFRELMADAQGGIDELLAKSLQQSALDAPLTAEDRTRLLEALREMGALDRQYRYGAHETAAERRGWAHPPGGGAGGRPEPSQPRALTDVLASGLWQHLAAGQHYEYQMPLFQPVGGMDAIARAMARTLPGRIRYGTRVVALEQDEHGVTALVEPASGRGAGAAAARQRLRAQWCVCTLPLSVLGQMELAFSAPLREAIEAVPYAASVKIGLQFRRRFWEEDEGIYGGITTTDLPIQTIGYPNHDFLGRKGVVLGAYAWGPNAYEFSAMPPEARVRHAVAMGAQIHPAYAREFECGASVAWHRVPFTLGCYAEWTHALRERHYATLCTMDRRVVLAGEHASHLPAWQEGAVLSAHAAIEQLHRHALAAAGATGA